MSEHLPTFGPSLVNGDEGVEPVVVVRVAYALSREQLVAALGVSFAEIAADRVPEELTVDEVRCEVESYLAAQGIIAVDEQLERDAQRVFSAEQQRVVGVLATAVERAYPAPPAPLDVQRPYRFRNGTVLLQTVDRGEVRVDEPSWCTGHDGEAVGYLADLTHNGPVIVARVETECHGVLEFLKTHLSWSPFAELHPEPYPVVAIEVGDGHDFDPAGVRKVAKALRSHASRLDRFADDSERLRGELS
ncbi:DUF6907 domain-containing protein [Streptomyces sp. KN37]|uniref:DUF6907 domain-containing protein n=1 Tax=Streptomyces sp. KN37 TaxID=3090667 RepID=UPI002A74E08D|nr:hypothetical protein [Streptomyces sp. KN37]WPO69943.1 hypothetical protein R9806_04505 [Streptomyces sp. KN37]